MRTIPTDDEPLLDIQADRGLPSRPPRASTPRAAVRTRGARDRELIALRYGADLKARDIGALLDERKYAVDVALHRPLERLRAALEQ